MCDVTIDNRHVLLVLLRRRFSRIWMLPQAVVQARLPLGLLFTHPRVRRQVLRLAEPFLVKP